MSRRCSSYQLLDSCWLLSSTSNLLKGTLGIVCKHRRYGALLYNKHGYIILKALSKALGTTQALQKSEACSKHEYSLALKSEDKGQTVTEQTVLQACTVLNTNIDQQIKKSVQTYQKDPLLCQAFDPELILEQLDPLPTQCIQILTKPTRERRQLFTKQDLHDRSEALKSKSIKQLFCLSTLFF